MSDEAAKMKTLVKMITFISDNGIYSLGYVREYAQACAPEWQAVLEDERHIRTIKNLLETNYHNPKKRYQPAPPIPGKERGSE